MSATPHQLSFDAFTAPVSPPARPSPTAPTRRVPVRAHERTTRAARVVRINDLAPAGGKVGAHHPETAHKAADAIAPVKLTQQARVRAYLAAHGPATDERMQEALQMSPSSERPRRQELQEQGHAQDSGERALTRSGRKAILWELTPAGRKVVGR